MAYNISSSRFSAGILLWLAFVIVSTVVRIVCPTHPRYQPNKQSNNRTVAYQDHDGNPLN